MRRLLRPSVLAVAIVILALVVGSIVIVATELRVDALAPITIFSVALGTVVGLLLPDKLSRR